MKTHLASFLRSLPSLQASSIALGALVTLAASTGCVITGLGPGSSPGADFSGDLPSRPLAAGATTIESITVLSSQSVNSVTSSDPSVVSVGPLQASAPSNYSVNVTGGKPGSATLTIYDGSGNALDHLDVQVAPTTTIQLDNSGGQTILTGQTYALHSTTIGAGGGVLVGDGAIHYAYTGSLAAGSPGESACDGDCAYFQASATGDGQVVFSASASTATATATYHAVAPEDIDSISLTQTSLALSLGSSSASSGSSAILSYDLNVEGQIAYGGGATCTSSNPNVVQVLAYPNALASGSHTGTVGVAAQAKGSATITCTFQGLQVTLPVTAN